MQFHNNAIGGKKKTFQTLQELEEEKNNNKKTNPKKCYFSVYFCFSRFVHYISRLPKKPGPPLQLSFGIPSKVSQGGDSLAKCHLSLDAAFRFMNRGKIGTRAESLKGCEAILWKPTAWLQSGKSQQSLRNLFKQHSDTGLVSLCHAPCSLCQWVIRCVS